MRLTASTAQSVRLVVALSEAGGSLGYFRRSVSNRVMLLTEGYTLILTARL